MSKTKTHAQRKAKKEWLLHKPSAKKARCRRQLPQPREDKNMAPDIKTSSSLSTTGEDTVLGSLPGRSSHWNEDLVRSSFSGNGRLVFVPKFKGSRHIFNSLIELLYNLMACGFQGLKGLGEKFCSSAEALLPGRSYKRKFEEVTQRLDGLESEVKRLKLELTKVDCCQHKQSSQSQPISKTSGSIVPAPPPSPPPPPPLVPPPPVFTVVKKKQKKSAEPKPTTTRAIVTLDDLLSVKLRSTRVAHKSHAAESDSLSGDRSDNQTRPPLQQLPINQSTNKHLVVSLKDIQNVSLRKLHANIEAAQNLNTSSPENNPLITRRNLRRVNVDRSPGGTPMVTERRESTGTGLTPMMTRALKRKFQFANPPSSSSPTSPCSRERRKSLSPLVSTPWSPLSMR